MVKALYFTAGKSVIEVLQEDGNWVLHEKPTPHDFRCLAVDETRKGRLYAGSFDHGLWISDDHGETWREAGAGIAHDRVLSVAVSKSEQVDGHAVVWAGTEPSHVYRSEDGGESWTDCPNLQTLSSKPEWSFPPRPHTHHVRFIQPDIHDSSRIFVGIELGGVMKSDDQGATWQDRKPGSQYDCHTLTMTPTAKGRLYEAAGGGFAESLDGGQTWQTFNDGLDPYSYLVEVAVDSGDPDTIIVSAAEGPRTAYTPEQAKTIIMRREKDQPWERVTDGLPNAEGSAIFTLVADQQQAGTFFAVNNLGVYQSENGGKTWERLAVDWPDHLSTERIWGLTAW